MRKYYNNNLYLLKIILKNKQKIDTFDYLKIKNNNVLMIEKVKENKYIVKLMIDNHYSYDIVDKKIIDIEKRTCKYINYLNYTYTTINI